MNNEKNRRSFLKHILVGSAAVAAVTAGKKQVQASNARRANRASDILYRESDDFKRYYESLRS